MSRVKTIPTTGIVRINVWVPKHCIPARWQDQRVTKGGAKNTLSYGAYIRAILEAVAEVQKERKKAPQEAPQSEQEAEPERAQECA